MLIGNERFAEEVFQRDFGESYLCDDALVFASGGDAGEQVSGSSWAWPWP